MARVICKAKQNGRVKHRGNPTIEFYKDGKLNRNRTRYAFILRKQVNKNE